MDNIEELIAFLVLYFQSRNAHLFGFVGYKCHRAIITHITGIKEVTAVRMIFERMVKQNWFIKRRTRTKTDYKFAWAQATA